MLTGERGAPAGRSHASFSLFWQHRTCDDHAVNRLCLMLRKRHSAIEIAYP